MKIGLIKEIKDKENRFALTPAGVDALARSGHVVRVQESAGQGSGFSDGQYLKCGAKIVSVESAWASDLVIRARAKITSHFSRPDLVQVWAIRLSKTAELARLI